MLSVSSKKAKSRRFAGNLAKTLLGAALLVAVSGTAFAQSMVVRSTGPSASSYPAGTKLPNNARVTLQSQDQLTVLSKAGTRVLRGPGTYTLNQRTLANSTRSTRLSSFISNRSSRKALYAIRKSLRPISLFCNNFQILCQSPSWMICRTQSIQLPVRSFFIKQSICNQRFIL